MRIVSKLMRLSICSLHSQGGRSQHRTTATERISNTENMMEGLLPNQNKIMQFIVSMKRKLR